MSIWLIPCFYPCDSIANICVPLRFCRGSLFELIKVYIIGCTYNFSLLIKPWSLTSQMKASVWFYDGAVWLTIFLEMKFENFSVSITLAFKSRRIKQVGGHNNKQLVFHKKGNSGRVYVSESKWFSYLYLLLPFIWLFTQEKFQTTIQI